MSDDGTTKDDVKVPEGEAGDKINKLFREDEKDTNVIILTAMGEEACIDAKEVSNITSRLVSDSMLTRHLGSKGLSGSQIVCAAVHLSREAPAGKQKLEHYSRFHVL